MAELTLGGEEKQLFEEWWETKMAWLWGVDRGPVPFTPARFKPDAEQSIALYKQAHNGLPFEGMNSLEGYGVRDIIPEDVQVNDPAIAVPIGITDWAIDWAAVAGDLGEFTWWSANPVGTAWGTRTRLHLRDINQQDWYVVWWGAQDLDPDPCQLRELILDVGDKAQAKIPIKDDIERNPLQVTWFDRAWLHTKQKGIAVGVATDADTGTATLKPLGFSIINSERHKAIDVSTYFRPNRAQ